MCSYDHWSFMDSSETSDQLTIVNRSNEHKISERLIRIVPYFDRILKESKDKIIELDFDDKALKSFLNWLESNTVSIEMDYVMHLYSMMDCFEIKGYMMVHFLSFRVKDLVQQDCINYFNDNFSLKYLPVIIPQATPVSKLITSSRLNAFICRYFLKIANTNVWLDYPVETIEYMCSLVLMIHSEYQVFDAIMKWIKAKADSRKGYIERLLKLVRWCHLEDKYLPKMKEQVQSLNCQPSKLSSFRKRDCDLTCNRTKQEYFIQICNSCIQGLRIIIYDNNFYPLIEKVVNSNKSMTIDFLHVEHVSDIFFDSGEEGVRIDWKRNEYRWLDRSQYKTYFLDIHNYIQEKDFWKDNNPGPSCEYNFKFSGVLLFEADEKYMLICNSWLLECWPANAELISKYFRTNGPNKLRATILDDNIYFLANSDFIKLNINTNEETIIGLERFKNRLHFDNLLITSRKANDDRVFLIDKFTKDVFCFNVNTHQWSSMGRIVNCKNKSVVEQKESNALSKTFTFTSGTSESTNLPFFQASTNKLPTFTSTFISLNTMRTMRMAHNENSTN
ncbi:uncharacterized protein LOC107370985 [Tetranychus urticae]|uniref:BACK domain-containing protein n=1 Tax=Tetranychus urticae TaxID=32264 RepID=T1JXL7_TETUR|nr:uncharacterized protein LOC107370985 [Tetranychus urticae]